MKRNTPASPVRPAANAIIAATLIALAVAIVAITSTLGARPLVASSPAPGDAPALATAATPAPGRSGDGQRRRFPPDQPPIDRPPDGQGSAPGEGRPGGWLPRTGAPREEALREQARSAADGAVPDGVTVFDHEFPAVANLDPGLLDALRRAATDAAADGVSFVVNSGWRSPAYQNQLLREAITVYGSEEEAARWVATAETSAHVSGEAVDIGPDQAMAWLSEHGVGYGLCQTYANEPWHYELRSEAVEYGCPPTYADPTDDPRMQP